jgi:hypothetical protein
MYIIPADMNEHKETKNRNKKMFLTNRCLQPGHLPELGGGVLLHVMVHQVALLKVQSIAIFQVDQVALLKVQSIAIFRT